MAALFLTSDIGCYKLSRIYEGAFQHIFYDYQKLRDNRFLKCLTYGKKLIFLKSEYSVAMKECVENDSFLDSYVLSKKPNVITKLVRIENKPFVIKRHTQHGFWKSLFKMGKCALIWNHYCDLENDNFPNIELVGFYENRSINRVETAVIYKWEGDVVISMDKDFIFDKVKNLVKSLRKNSLVHADLRLRNIIYNSIENELKLIDVELLHRYPKGSYLCKKRIDKEEKWLYEHSN